VQGRSSLLIGIRLLQASRVASLPNDDDLLAGPCDSGLWPGRIEQPAQQQRDDDIIGFRA
jgi:hypothetical protein